MFLEEQDNSPNNSTSLIRERKTIFGSKILKAVERINNKIGKEMVKN